MPKGFDLRCGAGKTARVWLQGNGGGIKPGQAMVLLPIKDGETDSSPAAYLAPKAQRTVLQHHRRSCHDAVSSDIVTYPSGRSGLSASGRGGNWLGEIMPRGRRNAIWRDGGVIYSTT